MYRRPARTQGGTTFSVCLRFSVSITKGRHARGNVHRRRQKLDEQRGSHNPHATELPFEWPILNHVCGSLETDWDNAFGFSTLIEKGLHYSTELADFGSFQPGAKELKATVKQITFVPCKLSLEVILFIIHHSSFIIHHSSFIIHHSTFE